MVRTRLVDLESVYPRTVRLRCDQEEMGTDEIATEPNNLPVVVGAKTKAIEYHTGDIRQSSCCNPALFRTEQATQCRVGYVWYMLKEHATQEKCRNLSQAVYSARTRHTKNFTFTHLARSGWDKLGMREEEEVRKRRPEVSAIDIGLPCTLRVKNVLRQGERMYVMPHTIQRGRGTERARESSRS